MREARAPTWPQNRTSPASPSSRKRCTNDSHSMWWCETLVAVARETVSVEGRKVSGAEPPETRPLLFGHSV
jgi:hypothetical protein